MPFCFSEQILRFYTFFLNFKWSLVIKNIVILLNIKIRSSGLAYFVFSNLKSRQNVKNYHNPIKIASAIKTKINILYFNLDKWPDDFLLGNDKILNQFRLDKIDLEHLNIINI